MFGKLLSAVLICQMLAHSIFGCCWHHLHCQSADDRQDVAAAEPQEHLQTTGHQCRHHHKSSPSSQEPQAAQSVNAPAESHESDHPAPAPCEEERCAVVLAVEQVAGAVDCDWLWANDVLPMERVLLLSDSPSFVEGATEGVACRATSRERCALLQTWLI